MDTLIYPTHCEIVVDSPDNDDDIRELGRICKEWLLNKQIVLLRRQNTDSNYFAKLCESIARDGIYNWRQCSWMPNGDLIELPDQVAGNIGYTTTPEANNDPWNNSKKLDFGKDMAEAEAKAWKTIWSAGHGVSSIDDNPACRDLIDKLKAEFIDSIESQKANLNFSENDY